jgi:hypothetical protein
MSELASYSEVDTRRFDKRIYRANVDEVSQVAALDILADRADVDMIIARCPVGRAQVVHALESSGYRLMDTLVQYAGPTKAFEKATWPHSIRAATDEDRPSLADVANDAFTGYDGHYHSDPRLDPRLATLGYVDWCLGCLGRQGHTVWVAVAQGRVMGFIAVRRDQDKGDIVLNGVASRFQRQGVYDSLLKCAGRTLFGEGMSEVRGSTHAGNLHPQRAWIRNGMLVASAIYTFHKWFDT